METRRISKYDGQTIQVDDKDAYELGNYLGGGSSGVVYECVHAITREHLALKILHSSHLKLVRSSALTRYVNARTGISSPEEEEPRDQLSQDKDGGSCASFPLSSPASKSAAANANGEEASSEYNASNLQSSRAHQDSTLSELTEADVHWLVHPGSKQVVAAAMDRRSGQLRELTLKQCMSIYGTDLDSLEPSNFMTKHTVTSLGCSITLPRVPLKYMQFLRQRQQTCNEIRNMQKIRGHENVLQLFEVLELVQESKSTLFLVLELASGGELFDRIRVDEGCDEQTALHYFRQLLSGVAYCHSRGLAHRDLKPENLLLADHDDGAVLKIADFGLSALCMDANQSQGRQQDEDLENGGRPYPIRRLMSVVGSPHYVAPEVLERSGEGYDGGKADSWSLGVILYALLNGNLPFGKDLFRCPRFAHFRAWKRAQKEMMQHPALDHAKAEGASASSNTGLDTISASAIADFPTLFFPRHLNPAVIDLLSGLLDPDPETRMTVWEAQIHPWVDDASLPVSAPGLSCEEEEEEAESFFDEMDELYHDDEDDEEDDDEDDEDDDEDDDENDVRERRDSSDRLLPCSSGATVQEKPPSPRLIDDLSANVDKFELAQQDEEPAESLHQSHHQPMPVHVPPPSQALPMRSRVRPVFQSPPLAPRRYHGRNGPDAPPTLNLEPLCKSPGSFMERRLHRSLSPPPRLQSDNTPESMRGNGCGIIQQHLSQAQFGAACSFSEQCRNGPLSSSPSPSACYNLRRQQDELERVRGSLEGPVAPVMPLSPTEPGQIQEFKDVVKRSTRFSTCVPANEVLSRIEQIVQSNPEGRDRVIVDYDAFQLYIFRRDMKVLSVRIFLVGPGTYMVEFLRESVPIFEFRKCYDGIRSRLAEIVKSDYSLALLDQL